MGLLHMTARQESIVATFDHRRPTAEQTERIERNRLAFKICALGVIENTREGPDQYDVLEQLHTVMMLANKLIACEPVAAEPPGPCSPIASITFCCEYHADEAAKEHQRELATTAAPVALYSADDPNPGC